MTICYSAIDICSTQINRLDCDNNVLSTDGNVAVSCSIVDITSTPILGAARDQQDPNGQGGYCAERNDPASIEGYTIEMTLCSKTDAELMELLGIFDLIRDASGVVVGVKTKGCSDDECYCDPGDDQCQPAVSLMLWHVAWLGKERHPDFKWVVEAFPKVIFDPGSVAITRNSEFNTYTVTGRAYCNDDFGQGPGAIYPEATGLDSYRGEWGTNVRPSAMCSCDLCGLAAAGTAVGN